MKQERWAIATVCLVLGMMLVVQFKTAKSIAENDLRSQRTGDLAIKLEETMRQRDELQKKLGDVMVHGSVESLVKENEILKLRAGLTPVEGKGISVIVEDSRVPIKVGENPNLYIIHDEDVLRIINELKAAGAEGIAINDQRLVANTEIRCVGPTITVNRKSFAPPFVIRAIGNPEALSSALTLRGGVVDTLKHWGIELQIKKEMNVVLPAYKESFIEDYMKPVVGGEAK